MEAPSTESLREALSTMLVESFRVEPSRIRGEAHLRDDLDLDSIDMVDMLSLINQRYGVFLSPFDFEGCATLGQFEERLAPLLSKTA